MRISDRSSDVCSSDLTGVLASIFVQRLGEGLLIPGEIQLLHLAPAPDETKGDDAAAFGGVRVDQKKLVRIGVELRLRLKRAAVQSVILADIGERRITGWRRSEPHLSAIDKPSAGSEDHASLALIQEIVDVSDMLVAPRP